MNETMSRSDGVQFTVGEIVDWQDSPGRWHAGYKIEKFVKSERRLSYLVDLRKDDECEYRLPIKRIRKPIKAPPPRVKDASFSAFLTWAGAQGHDIANAWCDAACRWVPLSPATAELWAEWNSPAPALLPPGARLRVRAGLIHAGDYVSAERDIVTRNDFDALVAEMVEKART